MKKLSIYLFVLCMLGAHFGFAQQSATLRGKVLDETGAPIGGATLSLQGTATATSTNDAGDYSITYTPPAVLVVNALGYVTQEVQLNDQTSMTFRLLASEETLDEVVVVGYGTQKRGEVTTAIASVKSEDFTKGSVRDAAQLIQGKVAGMRITSPGGDPTGATQINLRGLNSINGSQNPLILIDGIPGDLETVAPEDIESIDVLKDGSAAAIYGTRATGGVLLVTTRQNRSSESRTSIEYNGYVNVQTINRKPDMMTASDIRRLISEGYDYVDYGGDTNWLDEVLQTPVSQNHNLTFFGGNSRTNFTGSLNYRNWDGIMLKTGQERVNIRAALNHEMFDGKLRANIQVINGSSKSSQGGTGGGIWRQAMIRNPTDNIYNEDGGWQERNDYMYDNPLGLIHEAINDRVFRQNRFSGSLDYRPINDLSLKMLISRANYNGLTGSSNTFDHVSTTKNNLNGTARRSTSSNTEDLMELTANYNKQVGEHHFTVLGGYSYQYNVREDFDVYNYDFPTDEYSYNKLEAGRALQRGLATMSSEKSMSKLIGFFGRVNYSWKDRYMLTASVRREGSSAFGQNYRWGTFPGVSVAWNIANEEFMENATWASELKLRGGFGVTGTIANNPYQSQTSYDFDSGDGAYINGQWVPGFVPARNFNPDLRWEKKEEWNVGLDFGILGNRVSGSFDYYVRNVKDLLYNFPVPTPPYLFGSMMLNAGEMQNSGFEALVSVRAVDTKTVQWTTNVTFSTNKNKLVNLSNEQFNVTREFFDAGHTGEPIQISTHRVAVGGPIGQFFVYKSVGLDENGGWLVEDRNGDVISMEDAVPEDRQYYGNGIPKFNVGWNNTVNVKNFDLSVNFRGAFGHQVLNMQRLYYENPVNRSYNVLKTAFDPIDGKQLRNSLVYVSHYIEDADYLKIDNVTLGYTFNPKAIKGISALRVYASGMNLATFTGYKGIDPEAVSYYGDYTFAPGMDHRDKYPSTRAFTLGLNVTF